MAENDEQPLTVADVANDALMAWVQDKVESWERYRDQEYQEKWDEYYRLWRGIWEEQDKTRQSERSRLISPALQQAIEAQVAEIEEATIQDGLEFDIKDDYADERTDFQSPEEREQIQKAQEQIQQAVENGEATQEQAQKALQMMQQQVSQRQTKDVEHMKNYMAQNFDKTDVITSLSKIYLNAAIYGTGIGKIVADERPEKFYTTDEDTGKTVVDEQEKLFIHLEPISPYNFVIEPSATNIDDALGVAHKVYKSKHEVVKKQREGVYKKIPLEISRLNDDGPPTMEDLEVSDPEVVEITEYWGLVPNSLLEAQGSQEPEISDFGSGGIPDVDEDKLVEAVVTIANEEIILRAERNPFLMEDRPFVAFQFDAVPDTFWGRGVAEKGYNAQKALDGELRARMDGLALTVHPMLAVDSTKRVRGQSYTVYPGKSVYTNGPPKDTLMPFNLGDINSKTFENAADLERMVQMSTGSMDSAAPIENNRRNETASGMSQIQSGAIKRSKRTLKNVEQRLIKPFLKKSAWRFQQFDSKNFPMKDLDFLPHSSLGIMARELEQQQMIQLLSVVPQESEAFMILLKSIYENSSLDNREELVQSINQMMQPDPQQQKLQQLQLAEQQAKVQVQQTEAQENRADALKAVQEARKTAQEASLKQDELDIELMKEILDVVAGQQNQSAQSQTALAQELLRQQAASNNNGSQQQE